MVGNDIWFIFIIYLFSTGLLTVCKCSAFFISDILNELAPGVMLLGNLKLPSQIAEKLKKKGGSPVPDSSSYPVLNHARVGIRLQVCGDPHGLINLFFSYNTEEVLVFSIRKWPSGIMFTVIILSQVWKNKLCLTGLSWKKFFDFFLNQFCVFCENLQFVNGASGHGSWPGFWALLNVLFYA